jgi:hypothetical protein
MFLFSSINSPPLDGIRCTMTAPMLKKNMLKKMMMTSLSRSRCQHKLSHQVRKLKVLKEQVKLEAKEEENQLLKRLLNFQLQHSQRSGLMLIPRMKVRDTWEQGGAEEEEDRFPIQNLLILQS